MQLVNETGQEVFYSISSANSGDCGTIAVDGIADLPYYDNQSNVTVDFTPASGDYFVINVDQSSTGEQIEMAVKAE